MGRLDRALSAIRKLSNKVTSESRAKLCRHLIRLEEQHEVWHPHYATFADLVNDNCHIDIDVYRAFRAAERELGSEVVDTIGFWAATRAAGLAPAIQDELVNEFTAWVSMKGLHPSYQAVDEWLKHNHPELVPPPRPNKAKMRIEELEKELTTFKRAFDRRGQEIIEVKAKADKQATRLKTLLKKCREKNKLLAKRNDELHAEIQTILKALDDHE